MKTYYLKANELRDRLSKFARGQSSTRVVDGLMKPTCSIVDEVGRCKFDKDCTGLFFHVIDKRYEKEGPNTLIFASNTPVSKWGDFFTGDDALPCALDRIFDRATVFMMDGPSYRGRELETFSVEAVASVVKTTK